MLLVSRVAQGLTTGLFCWLLAYCPNSLAQSNNLYIGLDADLSSAASPAGRAIEKGALLAIDEINQQGLLKHKLHLISRDHRGNPRRGRDNLSDFSKQPGLVGIIGGVHTPVTLAELDLIHQHQLVYLIPWAAGSQLVENQYRPNYVFRLSVNDRHATEFLIKSASELGLKQPGLLLENTGWGRSNERAAQAYLQSQRQPFNPAHYFNWGNQDFAEYIRSIKQHGHDYILLVANASEATFILKSMLALPKAQRLPIVSHWGITSGDLLQQSWLRNSDIELYFLQTMDFGAELKRYQQQPHAPLEEQSSAKLKFVYRYCKRYPNCRRELKPAYAMGSAHSYDLVHLLARAIKASPDLERANIRHSLEQKLNYRALMPLSEPAFTLERHDALKPSSYKLTPFSTAHSSPRQR